MRRLAERHPELTQQWLQALARQVRRHEVQIARMLTADAATRVAVQIMVLAERFGEPIDGHVHIRHTLLRHEFARLAGVRREGASQAPARLVERGVLITTPGAFDVIDMGEVHRRARSACPDHERHRSASF